MHAEGNAVGNITYIKLVVYFSLKIAGGHAHDRPVILLQIVMLSPGVHLVKNHESQCRPNKSKFKKQRVLN